MVKIFPAQKKWLFIGQNHNVYAYCVLKQFRYTLFCVFMSSQGPLYEFKEITDFSLKKLILGSFFTMGLSFILCLYEYYNICF